MRVEPPDQDYLSNFGLQPPPNQCHPLSNQKRNILRTQAVLHDVLVRPGAGVDTEGFHVMAAGVNGENKKLLCIS